MREHLLVVVRIEREELVRPACSASRTGCARSRSSSPPRSIRTSGSRRSSRTRTGPSSIRPSSSPTLVRAGPANLTKFFGSPATKNTASPTPRSELLARSLRCARPDILGDRAGAALLALAPEDVAEARLALALRPRVHAVAEGAVAAASAPGSPTPRASGRCEDAGEDLEAGAAESFGDVLHLDRIAQVRLVGAVFAHRLGVGDERKLRRHRLAAGELLEHAAQHRLDRRRTRPPA